MCFCYSYSVENGKPLLKESAVTNLVEHPIQMRPPSKSFLGFVHCVLMHSSVCFFLYISDTT